MASYAEVKKKVARLVDEIVDTINKLHSINPRYGKSLKAGLPASKKEIAQLEAYVNAKIPPSYRAFLELNNGYKGLSVNGDFLSIKDILPGSVLHKRMKKWRTEEIRDYGNTSVEKALVIADTDGQPDVVYLDQNKPLENGEWQVVDWDHESDSTYYSDLTGYLERCNRYYGFVLKSELKKSKKK